MQKDPESYTAKASISALLALGYPTSTAELKESGEQSLPLQVMEQSATVGHENQGHLFSVKHPGYTCPNPWMNILYTPHPCGMQSMATFDHS